MEVPSHTHTATIRAENRNNQIISTRVYLDAYSVSTTDGGFDDTVTYNFGSSTRAQDVLTSQSHAYPAATAWKFRYAQDSIYELRGRLTTVDANSMYDQISISGDDLPQTAGEITVITLMAPYKSYTYDVNGNLVWRLIEIEKTYTITLDEDGVYNINFALEYADYENGIYVDDLDMDILVTVVLGTEEEPEDPESPTFVFGNTRRDVPWVNDNADIINEMPALDSGGDEN